ncbi:MAG TPA: hypothetical protein VI758_05120 [Bacteroidota bacterium]
MKCPHCHNVPMSFTTFLFIGWVHIRCGSCSSRLVLKSVGDRVYLVLSAGIVLSGVLWVYFEYPFRWLGEQATMILFVAVIISTLVVAAYYAWHDSNLEIR